MEKVYLDIMVNGKFYKQLTYNYSKLFIIDADEVKAFVLQKSNIFINFVTKI